MILKKSEMCNKKACFKILISHHETPQCVSTPGNVLWVHCIQSEISKLDFYTKCCPINHINYNKIKQNLTMNMNSKHDLLFNADLQKMLGKSVL